MKMTYTRAFSLATALCLLLGLALGCSSASTEQAASQTAQAPAGTSQTEQATEQAPAEQPTANDDTFTPPEGFTGGTPPQGFPGNFDGSNMPNGTPPDGFNGNFSGGTPPQGFSGNFDGNMPNGTPPSGGIMTTGGGVTYAYDLNVTTSGQSSAAIRTDRGGGTVYVDGGSYTSNGLGSPAIYSTAEIHVANATLVSNLSEGVCIEGKNSIELTDCDLTANNTRMNGNATFLDSIMIYQSMSGDADSGTSAFTMTGGTLTSLSGHVFHVTNTNAIITLTGVTVVNEDSEGVLLSVSDDGWSGAGNIATLNAENETLEGLLLVGSNATLTLNLTGGSAFTGTVSGAITNAKGDVVSTEVGTVHVTLDESSTWTLTGDAYVSSFTGDASSIVSNGYTLYVNGVALAGTK